MGKVPKLKKRIPSAKSRAARRAASPSAAVDKSLELPDTNPDTADPDLSILAARQGGGISKKKKQKPLSRQQRLRKEKGMARADAVLDKLEMKVKRSKDKSKVIKNRSAAWDDLNSAVTDHKPAKKATPTERQEPGATTEDVDMDNRIEAEDETTYSEAHAQSNGVVNSLDSGSNPLEGLDDIT